LVLQTLKINHLPLKHVVIAVYCNNDHCTCELIAILYTFSHLGKSKMFGNSTSCDGMGAVANQTFSAPSPRPSETSIATATFDSHTIPIIFGTIATILAVIAIIVTIAFGILQLRALNKTICGDTESGMARLQTTNAGPEPQATVNLTAAHRQSQVGGSLHESELSWYVSLHRHVAILLTP
jgi:hypothetical protein